MQRFVERSGTASASVSGSSDVFRLAEEENNEFAESTLQEVLSYFDMLYL